MIFARKEKKVYSVTAGYTDTVAGVLSVLTQGILPGDGANNRDGSQIQPFQWLLNITFISGIGSTNSAHRFIVFMDTLSNGVYPTVANLLDGSAWNSTYAILNDQQNRFKILHDETVGVVGASNSAVTHRQIKKRLKGTISYNGTTSVEAANGKNAIYMITLTDSITVSTASVNYYFSVHFTDA